MCFFSRHNLNIISFIFYGYNTAAELMTFKFWIKEYAIYIWGGVEGGYADASANTLASSHTHPPLCCLISFARVQGVQLVRWNLPCAFLKQ